MGPKHLVRLIRTILPLVLVLALPSPAPAQVKEAAQERLRLLNKDAMDEYDSLDFDKAKDHLLEAIEEAKKAGIVKGKRLASTYLNLGIVYGAGLNDNLKAVECFSQAIKLDPAAVLDAARATPTLEQMFQTAKDNVGQVGKAPEVEEPFTHKPVDESPVGRAIRIWVRLGEGAGATQVVLFYRFIGATGFQRIQMDEKKPGNYLAVIPPAPVEAKSVYYYIEAQDEAGQRVHGHATATSPNIISLIQRGEGPGPGPKTGPVKRVDIAVMAGFGAGLVFGGETENVHATLSKSDDPQAASGGPGGALAPFHIAAEVGYHVTEKWVVAGLFRLQLVNAIDKGPDTSSRVSALGELLGKRYFGDGALKFFMSGGLGGGQIRHRVPINPDPRLPNPIKVDARVAQYVAFGIGGGIVYMFTDIIGIVLNLNGIILVPNFAANLDTNLGLVLSF
jgi:hypothetical protein